MQRDLSNGQLRYYGRAKCKVIDNIDPAGKGRIRIDHPVFGESGWIKYLRTPGAFDVPSVKDLVFVEAEWGHPHYLTAWGNVTKGFTTIELPTAFQRKAPTNRGLYTPGGHLIELDDGLDTAPGRDVGTPQKGIRLTTKTGKQISIDDTNDSITIKDQSSNYIKIDTSSDSITIQCSNNVNVNCSGTATVNGSNVKLGSSAAEGVIKGLTFEAIYNVHAHPILGGPPAVLLTGTELSTKVKVE